jgi:hypothetical protein
MAMLNANQQLVCDYLTTDRLQFEEREASESWTPHASNPHSGSDLELVKNVGPDIIQSWHYTRFVEDEAQTIREKPTSRPSFHVGGIAISGPLFANSFDGASYARSTIAP